ncbi:hypothetical protein CVU37_07565 [candidate division BRC1 bacterium HGW-BRC1-1]|jgi:hypothetical protein|nr:MAG: hypothetical protein CVU37_07565 [candidate division BRC1 bacterium HGW-BRC1-1]
MLLFVFLDILVLGVLGAALWKISRLRTPDLYSKRKASLYVVSAFICVILMLILNVGVMVQDRAGTNLFLPGTVATKARVWVQANGNPPPQSDDVGRNIKIVGAGIDFYQTYKNRIPQEIATRMEPAAKLESTVTRLLSPAEERSYFEAAQTFVNAIGSLVPPTEAEETVKP